MGIKKGKTGRKFQYELSFRRKVSQEFLEGRLTAKQLAVKYNLSGGSMVSRWLKDYEKEQEELLSSGLMKEDEQKPEEGQEKEKTAEELEKELALAKAKIAVLETLIDVAEEQLGVEIRKKPGTKPSLE